MKKLIVAVVALAVAAPVLVWAGGGGSSGRVDMQSFAWTTDETSTSGTDWTKVQGLGLTTGCRGNPRALATASLVLSGTAPADIKVQADDPTAICIDCAGLPGVALRPGPVTVDLSSLSGPTATSFAFVAGRTPGSHGTRFRVYLRSPGGSPVTAQKGTLTVSWKRLEGLCA